MLIIKYVTVEGRNYPVTLSDNFEALQAAYAAGGAIVGLWHPSHGTGQGGNQIPKECLYLTDDPAAADSKLLEKAVRRRFHMPLIIGLTKRLRIREFKEDDPLESEGDAADAGEPGAVFCDAALRSAYINSRYRFYECGLWALEERGSGILAGKAGITDGELGYHIYRPFRRQGYGAEACRAIIAYAEQQMGLKVLFLKIGPDREASVRLAEALGFQLREEGQGQRIYEKKLGHLKI